MRINRVWSMPSRFTFSMPPVKALLSEEMTGCWFDPFAGENSPANIRNDADTSRPAEFHEDALDFMQTLLPDSFDGALFDPPYSVEQALRKYKPKHGGTAGRAEYWARCMDAAANAIRPGGKAIRFGWDSCGFGKGRGFRLNRVLLICHGACHNDTIITVEQKFPKASPTNRESPAQGKEKP